MLIKEQFQTILSHSIDDVNVFILDDDEYDVNWMLGVCQQVDVVIIDIDNCDHITKHFITFMLAQPNAYYITNDETVPYKLISKNRIYDLNQIVEQIKNQEEDSDDDVQ
jgi:hypothetical protein